MQHRRFEFPLLTSGDHVVEVLLNATTRRDAQDNVIGVVGIGQDITDARAKRDAEMKQRAAGNHKFSFGPAACVYEAKKFT